ncbi:DUF4268 domain-containing protein [Bacteroidales bacterium OttesenSCG-928-K03]|nr:DUF4268 domain-containing protein [Bacteroidales bacterium OttesenSCG-928-L14]MDL2240265.1 DUF4268 domain-containing protein [Bacteroidales bacterium OttesenSCG-928-K22]MDL2242787.1 DUF4268 domain-containing protein [Bacteroidales bacterium OttesenSCG-928-K03]
MYSKEQVKEFNREFWDEFKKYSKKRKKNKWIMQDTGINRVTLKFDIDNEKARVGFDIQYHDLEKRIYYYEKFESMKSILEDALGTEMIWDLEYPVTDEKQMAKIYIEKQNVGIYKKETWNDVFSFFYKNMKILERLFNEYYDFIKYEPDYGTN